MKIRITALIICLSTICIIQVHSQTIENPNCALKSHETLLITKVDVTPTSTLIWLSVENRRSEGGNFCADKKIYILYPDGTKLNLRKAKNIPVCPQAYIFKTVGEKLQFTLEFPPLKAGIKWIDIIEDCTSNCFWFYGVTLDNELNSRLDNAFDQAAKGQSSDNISLFKDILDDIDNQNLGIEGLLYINIINAAHQNADKVNMSVWYKRMASSHAPRLDQYLKYLNDKGIKF